jgi:putative transposase
MERYRIVKDISLYYITFTIVEWLPVFIDETACEIVTDSLNYCIHNKFLGVNAYVILPTHLHAILFDIHFDAERLKHTLDDMRKFTGRRLAAHAALHLPKVCRGALQENAGKDRQHRFGSRLSTRWGSRAHISGNKILTIRVTISVGKDWCGARRTGGFCQPKPG